MITWLDCASWQYFSLLVLTTFVHCVMASDNWRDGSGSQSMGPHGLQGLSPYALDPAYLPRAPEFIFPVETRKRSWNEKWFDRVGTSYLLGHAAGGLWGLQEGLSNMEVTTSRMRANSLLNGLTRRGPFMANTLAVLTLVYSPMESALGYARGKQDLGNSVVAAAITGALYKSAAGSRAIAVASLTGCAVIGVAHMIKLFLGQNGVTLLDYT